MTEQKSRPGESKPESELTSAASKTFTDCVDSARYISFGAAVVLATGKHGTSRMEIDGPIVLVEETDATAADTVGDGNFDNATSSGTAANSTDVVDNRGTPQMLQMHFNLAPAPSFLCGRGRWFCL